MNLKRIIGRICTYFSSYGNYGFNNKKYWKCRDIAIKGRNKPLIIRLMALRYVNKVNHRFGASIYTGINNGCTFNGEPILPHQLNGIIIASTAKIGKNVTILQQVTIGGNPVAYDGSASISKAATIGDNVIIGAGAKIIGEVKIGNNVLIGANAVVITDIPDDCIAVGVPAIAKTKK